ncbi:alpha-2,8-polysialyltransferase family protein [Bacteroides xylanisolvens]|mgnify:CR=1 FL=1|jgi:hypothetical protein|uniref:alpha-2,8-polysialyltransferase family protein n=1 Tax=Bacteroides xylanisolvens TaxID=371601 RepID=UPI001C38279A|nr:alpha-2,8-polysialyltransferase family protein [Bacteroides xylanisolvens]MBV4223337.1 alpha-2,8-polysialyltransferase family protein [Bacteroides xylanisolvens]
MNRSIIFSQAPAKIVAVLNCYEHELSEGREITIVVRASLKGLYQFYKELGLKANIQIIEDRGSVLYFWKNKRQDKDLIRLLNLNKIDDIKVFFTDIYDYGMGKIMHNLMSFYPIHILSPLDVADGECYEERQQNLSFVHKCKEIICSYVYKISLCYIYGEGCWTLVMDNRKLNFPKIDYSDRKVCDRYKKTISVHAEKTVIFFTEPYRFSYQSKEEYDEMNRQIIDEIHRAGYKVAVKGHPRIGCQEDAERMADELIANYIPAEYIDFSTFDFAIGFTSTSLCEVANDIKAYSVFKMCTVTDKKAYLDFAGYMERNGRNVKFIKSYSEMFE